jgi:hypothetical protein
VSSSSHFSVHEPVFGSIAFTHKLKKAGSMPSLPAENVLFLINFPPWYFASLSMFVDSFLWVVACQVPHTCVANSLRAHFRPSESQVVELHLLPLVVLVVLLRSPSHGPQRPSRQCERFSNMIFSSRQNSTGNVGTTGFIFLMAFPR